VNLAVLCRFVLGACEMIHITVRNGENCSNCALKLGSTAENAVARNSERPGILLPGNKPNIDRWAKKGSGFCPTACVGVETGIKTCVQYGGKKY